jgi:hypothetical protein
MWSLKHEFSRNEQYFFITKTNIISLWTESGSSGKKLVVKKKSSFLGYFVIRQKEKQLSWLLCGSMVE